MANAVKWDGTSWVSHEAKVWAIDEETPLGAWVIQPIKHWDGTQWVFQSGSMVLNKFGGAPTSDGFQVSVQTQDISKLRLRITTMADAYLFTTEEVSVPDYGITKLSVSTLSSFTRYKAIIETYAYGVWTTTDHVVMCKTLPPATIVGDYTYKIAMTGCQRKTSDELTSWTDINTWNPDWHIQGGDWHYINETTTIVDNHRKNWMNQLTGTPGMADTFSKYGMLAYMRSDHDGGGTQVADVQHPSTAANMEAYHQVIPHYPSPEFVSQAPALCFSFGIGDVLFICTDIRNLSRSDADDAEGPSKTALGPEQTEWAIEQFQRTDYAIKALITDCPWPGLPNQIEAKKDHWARYIYNRDLLAAEMELVDGVIVQFDYHGLVGSDGVESPAGWPLLGCAGSDRSCGNIRELDLVNYDYTFGGWPCEGVAINVWGKFTVARVGNVVTITMTGRNALAEVDEFTVTKVVTL